MRHAVKGWLDSYHATALLLLLLPGCSCMHTTRCVPHGSRYQMLVRSMSTTAAITLSKLSKEPPALATARGSSVSPCPCATATPANTSSAHHVTRCCMSVSLEEVNPGRYKHQITQRVVAAIAKRASATIMHFHV
jgi:hypothetical protein